MKKNKNSLRHFIDLNQINEKDLKDIIKLANSLKADKKPLAQKKLLDNKNLMMIFEKTSTRTRVSFEVAINQLGGNAVVMNRNDSQLGKGETVSDTAQVLSRYVDFIMLRANSHQSIIDFVNNSNVPVINGLSDFSHPCQVLASIMTIEEKLGKISGKKLAWLGDQNNVLNSYIHACKPFGFELAIASPSELDFCHKEINLAKKNKANISLHSEAKSAIKNADVVITDTWFSMGDESESNDALKQKKINLLTPFQVSEKMMKLAKKSAIFTHCLPVYRGNEVTANVADSSQSVIFDEAENRLHMQKAILLWVSKN
jgi:ornithine carbamoyltransferase